MIRLLATLIAPLAIALASQSARADEIICHANDAYFVVVISPYDPFGTRVLAGERAGPDATIECSGEPATRRELVGPGQAVIFDGLMGQYAALRDISGVRPILNIFDLNQPDPVLGVPVTEVSVYPEGIFYLEIVVENAAGEDCRPYAELIAKGTSVVVVQHKLFNVATAAVEVLGDNQCVIAP